eukprot:CAMPEP_0184318326 /NCGR_PEP_ID=MMETSP1049-20130417/101986_1 /TAXON_ID=77928 /ORGANISM="Proteomonas sulcata, Strain CCMP704" /LENGTH=361 /DNA_ID=CAMNT_0026638059 /DNA_START=133 /DNA_END=1218 /DNA_ORIENTATION=+
MPRVDIAKEDANIPLSSATTSKLKSICSEMMLTMGESIVGLTVWNLKQATTNIKFEKQRQAQQSSGDSQAGARMPFGKNFLLDPEALTFTRDLLSYYLKQVRAQQPREEVQSRDTMAAPPPVTDAPTPVGEYKGAELPYTADDIKYLIEIVEHVINAHKAPRAGGADGSVAQGVQEKQRMFKEVLSKYKVDPEVGLPEKLKERFYDAKFDQSALANYLSLSMPQHGFLARACGFFDMQLDDGKSGGSAQQARFEPLPRKRSYEAYAAEELNSAMEGKDEESESKKRRAFDVLTRLRMKEPASRECNLCGRVTYAESGMYERWAFACPMSGGRWRAPLEWHWDLPVPSSEEPVTTFIAAPPP